jgi:hypothetical protein
MTTVLAIVVFFSGTSIIFLLCAFAITLIWKRQYRKFLKTYLVRSSIIFVVSSVVFGILEKPTKKISEAIPDSTTNASNSTSRSTETDKNPSALVNSKSPEIPARQLQLISILSDAAASDGRRESNPILETERLQAARSNRDIRICEWVADGDIQDFVLKLKDFGLLNYKVGPLSGLNLKFELEIPLTVNRRFLPVFRNWGFEEDFNHFTRNYNAYTNVTTGSGLKDNIQSAIIEGTEIWKVFSTLKPGQIVIVSGRVFVLKPINRAEFGCIQEERRYDKYIQRPEILFAISKIRSAD